MFFEHTNLIMKGEIPMNEFKKVSSSTMAPDLIGFYNCSQEEFEKYWMYYMEFSPDYFVG